MLPVWGLSRLTLFKYNIFVYFIITPFSILNVIFVLLHCCDVKFVACKRFFYFWTSQMVCVAGFMRLFNASDSLQWLPLAVRMILCLRLEVTVNVKYLRSVCQEWIVLMGGYATTACLVSNNKSSFVLLITFFICMIVHVPCRITESYSHSPLSYWAWVLTSVQLETVTLVFRMQGEPSVCVPTPG